MSYTEDERNRFPPSKKSAESYLKDLSFFNGPGPDGKAQAKAKKSAPPPPSSSSPAGATKPDKKQKKPVADSSSALKLLDPPPEFLPYRVDLWQQFMESQRSELSSRVSEAISVTLPDGKVVDAESWKTTPYQIAQGISQGLADAVVVAKLNGSTLWDMDRPLEESCSLELLKFDSEEGNHVFWHSSAHILGQAMERLYGGHLCAGPPVEGGFYYDMFMEDRQVSSNDFKAIEDVVKSILKEKQPFERCVLSKQQLLDLFAHNPFKRRIIEEKVQTDRTTAYRCGPLIDLCRGPHIRNTGKVKAFQVTKNSSSYWEGKSEAESLQRIYAVSFPDTKLMKEYKQFQEEAAKRDHRKIGRDQELFFFHELSPGSCFFQPRGAIIFNRLVDFIKEQYWKRGFSEVISPNIYNTKLWQQSGHWQHYAENMFATEIEKEIFALKPMNCPGHCLLFDHRPRSWRELPLRLADFGVLHRNEISGALSGLTRVRRFQQDDAHIFCRQDQIKSEIKGCLDFMTFVYGIFGFTFELKLSTRPEKFLGDVETWNNAEKQLSECLDEMPNAKWELNPGDGAFYGPKIDITIKDALRRSIQCATIQLDFQLPERFNLSYITGEASEEGDAIQDRKRPVIIHRAILGSVERMLGILTEHTGGKWPFWLSPRQAVVVPVAPPFDDYAVHVKDALRKAEFVVDADLDPGNLLNKKIRNNQLAQYNFILVVGDKEKESGTVNIRTRDNVVHGEKTISQVIERFNLLREQRLKDSEESF